MSIEHHLTELITLNSESGLRRFLEEVPTECVSNPILLILL